MSAWLGRQASHSAPLIHVIVNLKRFNLLNRKQTKQNPPYDSILSVSKRFVMLLSSFEICPKTKMRLLFNL